MDAYGCGTSRRGEDACTAAVVAAAGAVGGDDAAVGGVRARDLRAKGAEMYRVSAAGNVPLRAAVPARRGGLIDVA